MEHDSGTVASVSARYHSIISYYHRFIPFLFATPVERVLFV